MTQWGLDVSTEILKRCGSVDICGVPGREGNYIFSDQATLIDWAARLIAPPPIDESKLTLAVAQWKTDRQSVIATIESFLSDRSTGIFSVHK